MVFDSSLYDLDKKNFHEIYSKFLEEITISFPNKLGYYSRGKSIEDLKSINTLRFNGFGYDQKIDLKIRYYDTTLKFLEEIIKNVSNRTFQIKNAIEWNKFQAGM